jgi:hypothetical protein
MNDYKKIVSENPETIDIKKSLKNYETGLKTQDQIETIEALENIIFFYLQENDQENAEKYIELLNAQSGGKSFEFFENRFSKSKLSIYKKSYPIVLAIVAIINAIFYRSIMKNPKIFGLFMSIIPCWYAWNISVNNIGISPAWSFSKYSIFGMEIFRMQLEDYFFYPLCSWMLYIIIGQVDIFKKAYKSSLIFILALLVFYSHFDAIGFSISILVFPFFCIVIIDDKTRIYFSNKTFLIMNAIFVPLSGLWDINSTTIKLQFYGLVEWYYPKSSGLFNEHLWLWNSPFSITPYLSIAGIFITYVVYCFLESRYKSV